MEEVPTPGHRSRRWARWPSTWAERERIAALAGASGPHRRTYPEFAADVHPSDQSAGEPARTRPIRLLWRET